MAALIACSGCGNAAPSQNAQAAVSRNGGTQPANAAPDVGAGEDSVQTPAAGGVVETTFDDLTFAMEKTDDFLPEMLTPEIEALFGRKIRLRGYILPTMRRNGLKQFVLVRDNLECCFGPGAALFDCVLVQMVDGATAEYSIRPVAVEGTFRFQELKDPVTGRHLAVFQIEGESVD